MKHIHNTISDDHGEIEITYAYYPEEARVDYYPDGSGYPGASAYCEVLSVECEGEDITAKISSKEWESLEAECLENHDEAND
jgi:hypothetical protein